MISETLLALARLRVSMRRSDMSTGARAHRGRSTRHRVFAFALCSLAIVSVSTSCAQREGGVAAERSAAGAPATAADSVREFVAEFYHWYMLQASTASSDRLWYSVLDHRASVLDDDLRTAMLRDREEQRAARGELVGLESDPFLNSQDPCATYSVTGVVRDGQRFRVEIRPECGTAREAQAPFHAVVARSDGAWVFVDVEYPDEFGRTLLKRLER